MNILFEKKLFVDRMASKFRCHPDKINEILKDQFRVFEFEKIPEYEKYLDENIVIRKTFDEIQEEKRKKEREEIVYVVNEKCPICGARIINDDVWRGKKMKDPGFRCSVGGLTHCLQWKVNNIRRFQKLPIVFKEIEKDA